MASEARTLIDLATGATSRERETVKGGLNQLGAELRRQLLSPRRRNVPAGTDELLVAVYGELLLDVGVEGFDGICNRYNRLRDSLAVSVGKDVLHMVCSSDPMDCTVGGYSATSMHEFYELGSHICGDLQLVRCTWFGEVNAEGPLIALGVPVHGRTIECDDTQISNTDTVLYLDSVQPGIGQPIRSHALEGEKIVRTNQFGWWSQRSRLFVGDEVDELVAAGRTRRSAGPVSAELDEKIYREGNIPRPRIAWYARNLTDAAAKQAA